MITGQEATPYADAVRAYADSHRGPRLHLPGHGGGTAGSAPTDQLFGPRLADLDLMPMLEPVDLGPEPTPFTQARRLAAQAWGARRTWFLTNGASQGNQLAALAMRAFGDVLVVQRSVHSSLVDGLVLSGSQARFIPPIIDAGVGAAQGVTAAAVAEAISAAPAGRVSGVYVVSPSYFGFVSDIAAIARVVHAAGLPLVVDEAWGAHLGFHPALPPSALAQGADLVISSTHKLGGALTQAAMLHLADGPWAERLEQQLLRVHPVLQSTSESAILLASLDLARRDLATGADRIARSIAVAQDLRGRVRGHGRFAIADDRYPDIPGWAGSDPLRVVIDTRAGGISGHEARTTLHWRDGLLVELATETAMVAVIGARATPDVTPLVDALHRLPAPGCTPTAAGTLPGWGPTRMSIREAFLAPSEVVEWQQAIGRVAAASLSAYPPGIPNILPGEEILPEIVDYLHAVAMSPGGTVRGALDPGVNLFRVVAAHQPA